MIAKTKEEIEILKLVGATNWQIKKPFIQEGVSYGFSGAIVAWMIISLILLYLRPFISSFLKGIDSLSLWQITGFTLYIWPPNLYLFGLLWLILIVFGVMIGLVGSLFAVSRYIRSTN